MSDILSPVASTTEDRRTPSVASIESIDVTSAAWRWRLLNFASIATIVSCTEVVVSVFLEFAFGKAMPVDAWEIFFFLSLILISLMNVVANWRSVGLDSRSRKWMAVSWAALGIWSGLPAFLFLVLIFATPSQSEPLSEASFVSGVRYVLLFSIALLGLAGLALIRFAKVGKALKHLSAAIDLTRRSSVPTAYPAVENTLFAVGFGLAAIAMLTGPSNVASLAALVGVESEWPRLSSLDNLMMGLGWFLMLKSRTYLQPDIDRVRAADRRAPVLYLRSFADDERVSFRTTRSFYGVIDVSLEQRLAGHFARFGPFIAVRSPADPAPMLGAARATLSNDEWRDAVRQWMDAASCIVICVGKTRWVNWELRNIIERGHQDKLIIIFPQTRFWLFQRRNSDATERLFYLKHALKDTPWARLLNEVENPADIRSILLDKNGGLLVVTSKNFHRSSYQLAAMVAHKRLMEKADTAGEPAFASRNEPKMQRDGGSSLTSLLSVRDLSVAFSQGGAIVSAVDRISFDIAKGETVALVGESGSGKSVSALSVLKLLPYPTASHPSGEILFGGKDLLALDEKELRRVRGNKITMIFQEPMTSLNPLHTIEQQIGEILALHQGMRERAARERTIELLHEVGIRDPEKRLGAYPHQLSGGQRQRVMIAMALANEPELLIADEPTTALDVTVQAQILELLAQLKARKGMSMLFITHDLGIVRKIADRVCVMTKGKIVEAGPTAEIFANPQHDYTRHLLAAEPKGKPPAADASARIVMSGNDIKVWFPIKQGFFRKVVDHVKAVDGIDVTVRAGQTLGVVGESGSGKTTLGLALARMISSQGSIHFNGRDIDKLSFSAMRPLRRELQIVFQDPFGSLSPRMSVSEIIDEGLAIHEPTLSEAGRDARVVEVLQEVGLDPETRFRYPHEFSGGQRQRIAIARAMVLKPRFVMLDEPTSALDMSVQAQVVDLLRHLQAKHDLAYLFISHDLKVIRALANDVIVMRNGKIVEYGPAQQIFERPQSDYTKALISAAFNIEAAPLSVVAQ